MSGSSLSPEARSGLEQERAAIGAWLNGDRAEPFILHRHDEYQVDAVFFPTLRTRWRFNLRYLMVNFGDRWPGCRLKTFFYRLAGVTIGRGVCIAPGAVIDPLFPQLIEIFDEACLGMGCRLITHEYTTTICRIGRIRVGRGAVVGAYSTVRSGVTIGEKANVGFNSFVNRDVKAGDTVVGVPARSIAGRRDQG